MFSILTCSVSLSVHLQNIRTLARVLSLRSVGGGFRSAVGAVAKLAVFCDLQLGGVGGRDAVPRLHAVALFQL